MSESQLQKTSQATADDRRPPWVVRYLDKRLGVTRNNDALQEQLQALRQSQQEQLQALRQSQREAANKPNDFVNALAGGGLGLGSVTAHNIYQTGKVDRNIMRTLARLDTASKARLLKRDTQDAQRLLEMSRLSGEKDKLLARQRFMDTVKKDLSNRPAVGVAVNQLEAQAPIAALREKLKTSAKMPTEERNEILKQLEQHKQKLRTQRAAIMAQDAEYANPLKAAIKRTAKGIAADELNIESRQAKIDRLARTRDLLNRGISPTTGREIGSHLTTRLDTLTKQKQFLATNPRALAVAAPTALLGLLLPRVLHRPVEKSAAGLDSVMNFVRKYPAVASKVDPVLDIVSNNPASSRFAAAATAPLAATASDDVSLRDDYGKLLTAGLLSGLYTRSGSFSRVAQALRDKAGLRRALYYDITRPARQGVGQILTRVISPFGYDVTSKAEGIQKLFGKGFVPTGGHLVSDAPLEYALSRQTPDATGLLNSPVHAVRNYLWRKGFDLEPKLTDRWLNDKPYSHFLGKNSDGSIYLKDLLASESNPDFLKSLQEAIKKEGPVQATAQTVRDNYIRSAPAGLRVFGAHDRIMGGYHGRIDPATGKDWLYDDVWDFTPNRNTEGRSIWQRLKDKYTGIKNRDAGYALEDKTPTLSNIFRELSPAVYDAPRISGRLNLETLQSLPR